MSDGSFALALLRELWELAVHDVSGHLRIGQPVAEDHMKIQVTYGPGTYKSGGRREFTTPQRTGSPTKTLPLALLHLTTTSLKMNQHLEGAKVPVALVVQIAQLVVARARWLDGLGLQPADEPVAHGDGDSLVLDADCAAVGVL